MYLAVGGIGKILLLDSVTYTQTTKLRFNSFPVRNSYLPQCIRSLEFSSVGGLLACGTSNGLIMIWNLFDEGSDDANCRTLSGAHTAKDELFELSFTRDGDRLLSCGTQRRACVWNVAEQAVMFQFTVKFGLVLRFIEDDAAIVFVSTDNRITVCDSVTGAVTRDICSFPCERPCTTTMNQRGDLIAVARDDGEILVSELRTESLHTRRLLIGHSAPPSLMSFDVVTERLVTCCLSDKTIRVWDFDNTYAVFTFTCDFSVKRLIIHPDGNHVIAVSQTTQPLAVYEIGNDTPSFPPLRIFEPTCASFSPSFAVLM
jgi:WD40 repeat protein